MLWFICGVGVFLSLVAGCFYGSKIPTTTITPLKVSAAVMPMIISLFVGAIAYAAGWGALNLAPLSWDAFYSVCGGAMGSSLVGVLAGYLYGRFLGNHRFERKRKWTV
jgi:hypothetical protein